MNQPTHFHVAAFRPIPAQDFLLDLLQRAFFISWVGIILRKVGGLFSCGARSIRVFDR